MSQDEFKLSTTLYGHSSDVRYVNVNHDNCIISGSRDKYCKFWRPNGINPGFSESITFKGHTKFVSSVCSLKPSAEYPEGVIVSGGNDSNICVYTTDNPEPIVKHAGHKDTVCCVSRGNAPNTFLTSSWDCTAKLWRLINNSLQEVVVFVGHQMSVWAAVQLPNGNVVTGSADKEVIIWSESGQKLKVCKGHTDCVRAVAVLNGNSFLTASNDASIKQWTLDGELIDTFYGHESFIYSISVNNALGNDCFVTSGEDRTVKCWQNGRNTHSIQLPAQSIWSVACLPNGDIIAGSSDGVIRIFTLDSNRLADEHQLKMFEEEVAKINQAANQEIGGVKISDLPGREVLYEPGRTDGQMKMIREAGMVCCYSWSAEEEKWNKVGDVMGAAGGTQATSGKTLYEGKEYDYVFSVDIEDGKPPLKLPYNRDQDPWFVAQEFIYKNNLPQSYLDQVANFIVTNSNNVQITQTSQSSDFVDPFTGESRYLPGSGTAENAGNRGLNLDPFTGGSSYSTSNPAAPRNVQNLPTNPDPFTSSESHVSSKPATMETTSKYFPHMSYLLYEHANLTSIYGKLKEFNKKRNADESVLEGVMKLAEGTYEDVYIDGLKQLLSWPNDVLFPVLDVARLTVLHLEPNAILCSHNNSDDFMQLLRKCIVQDNPANKMLALRILCNMFSHPPGEKLIIQNERFLCQDIVNIGENLNKHCQIALSTFLLDLAIALVRVQNNLSILSLIELTAVTILKLTDLEADFRGFVAMGTSLVHIKKTNFGVSNLDISTLRDKLRRIYTMKPTCEGELRDRKSVV